MKFEATGETTSGKPLHNMFVNMFVHELVFVLSKPSQRRLSLLERFLTVSSIQFIPFITRHCLDDSKLTEEQTNNHHLNVSNAGVIRRIARQDHTRRKTSKYFSARKNKSERA